MASWVTPWKRPGRSRRARTSTPTVSIGNVASSRSGPTTSTPGNRQARTSKRSGIRAIHAATVPNASQPISGSSPSHPPARNHATTNVTAAALADATMSHAARSTMSTPGCWAPIAVPTAVTRMSPAVVHHTASCSRRCEVRTSSHGMSAAITPAAIRRPQRRAPGTLCHARHVVCRGDVPAGLHGERHGDGRGTADQQARAQPALVRPSQQRHPGDRVDHADDQPRDDPPVLVCGLGAGVGDAQADDDGDRNGTDQCHRRREHDRWSVGSRPGSRSIRSRIASSVPRVRRLESRADGTAVPMCARPRSGHERVTR